MRGRFLTFEGGEGVGKTTQQRLLAERLRRFGIDPVTTREPGGGIEGAEAIRNLLVEETRDWDPLCEAMLHYAARREHVAKRIEPELAEGRWVLCDRFHDSTVAYQCYGQNVRIELVELLRSLAIPDVQPDLTLVLELATPNEGLNRRGSQLDPAPLQLELPMPGEGLNRVAARNPNGTRSRYEAMDEDFHRRVRDGFRKIAENERKRVRIVDAGGSRDSVAGKIWDIVRERFRDEMPREGGPPEPEMSGVGVPREWKPPVGAPAHPAPERPEQP